MIGELLGMLVTTTSEVPGYRVLEIKGLVRGITVRSISISQGFSRLLSWSTYLGGRQEGYTPMCEQAREEAYEEMVRHAELMGANAVIAMRYDATELAAGGTSSGMTEVLAYGTAVVVVPDER